MKVWKGLDGLQVYQLTKEADPIYTADVFLYDGEWTFKIYKRGTEKSWSWKGSYKRLVTAQNKALKVIAFQRQLDINEAKAEVGQ